MTQTHKIKLELMYADAVLSGDKNFELRLNDRGYQKGDLVQFEVRDCGIPTRHELKEKTYIITYVLSGFGLRDGWVVFGIKEH